MNFCIRRYCIYTSSVLVQLDLAEDVICCESNPSKPVWPLVCGNTMLATSYSSNFTTFKKRAGRIGSCGGFLLRSTLSTDSAAAVVAYSLSIAFHIARFVVTLIHVSLLFFSFPFVSSVSSGLKKSFVSSSHLFFGLPTGLFVCYLVLRPGFHFAFFVHRVTMQFPSSSATSFFCACQNSMRFFAVFILSTAIAVLLFTKQSNLLHQFQLCPSLHRYFPRRKCRCLGRNRC